MSPVSVVAAVLALAASVAAAPGAEIKLPAVNPGHVGGPGTRTISASFSTSTKRSRDGRLVTVEKFALAFV